jgi:glucokinase
MNSNFILAGDIGGTKTLLGLYVKERGARLPLLQKEYPSQKFSSLEKIIADFIDETGEKPAAASFAVAGPVLSGRSQITNLPWIIDVEIIRQSAGIPRVHLMNDLQATAAAVPTLEDDDLFVLRAGKSDPTGTIAIIAPGTGLGEAFLTWNGQRYIAHPCEGGHASFAPGTALEVELLVYLYPKFGHLSFERVGSGSGIPNLYEFLLQSGRYYEPDWLKAELLQADDRTPIIIKTALAGQADICVATLDLFVRILGGEVGNFALNVFSTGGIYLGGGIPPRILPRLQEPDFLEAISHKGRLKRVIDLMPVHVILDPEVTLLGAAYEGLIMFAAG